MGREDLDCEYCLLEVHQRADGSVHVPAALRPWLGGHEVLTPGMSLAAPVPVGP